MIADHVDLVVFDYWNTLVHEARRGALVDARLPDIRRRLLALGHDVALDDLAAAHRVAQHRFETISAAGTIFETPHAARAMASELGFPDAAVDAIEAIDRGFMRGSADAEVHLVAGVDELLGALVDQGVACAIVCDVGLTPSTVLLRWLEGWGLAGRFAVTAFSDVIGEYKPGRKMFDHVIASVGEPDRARVVHIGDRRRTDVAGARAAGIRAVRFAGVDDDTSPLPDAEHVVASMGEFSTLLAGGFGSVSGR